jgi:ATP synthase protein I
VPDRDDRPGQGRPSLSLSTLAGLGLANSFSLVIGLVVGHYLDGRFGTAPVFVLVGLVLGLTLGAVGSFLEVRRYLQD